MLSTAYTGVDENVGSDGVECIKVGCVIKVLAAVGEIVAVDEATLDVTVATDVDTELLTVGERDLLVGSAVELPEIRYTS